MIYIYICLVFVCCSIFPIHSQDISGICGLAEPAEGETCVSVKLPWESKKMHFCKKDLSFRKCPWNFTCYNNRLSDNALEIKAPWMCCSTISYPEPCINMTCPTAPFNRTCTPKKINKAFCCDNFFCGDAAHKDKWPDCSEIVCPDVNRDKGCITFYDFHGCCPRSQCPNDAKKGNCPAIKDGEVIAQWLRDAFRSKTYKITSCVGDYTCKDDMKCCPGYQLDKRSWGYCYQLPKQ